MDVIDRQHGGLQPQPLEGRPTATPWFGCIARDRPAEPGWTPRRRDGQRRPLLEPAPGPAGLKLCGRLRAAPGLQVSMACRCAGLAGARGRSVLASAAGGTCSRKPTNPAQGATGDGWRLAGKPAPRGDSRIRSVPPDRLDAGRALPTSLHLESGEGARAPEAGGTTAAEAPWQLAGGDLAPRDRFQARLGANIRKQKVDQLWLDLRPDSGDARTGYRQFPTSGALPGSLGLEAGPPRRFPIAPAAHLLDGGVNHRSQRGHQPAEGGFYCRRRGWPCTGDGIGLPNRPGQPPPPPPPPPPPQKKKKKLRWILEMGLGVCPPPRAGGGVWEPWAGKP